MFKKEVSFIIGITADVTTTLDLIRGMECGSQCNSSLMTEYQNLLSDACKDYDKHKLTYDTLVEFIIVGEHFKLKILFPAAIQLASKCKTELLKSCSRYHKISDENRIRIAEQRAKYKEYNNSDVHLY